MRAIRTATLMLLLASCTGGSGTATESISPTPPSTPTPTVQPLPEEALPVPEPSPWSIEPGAPEDRPSSPDVAVGSTRPLRLYTHCGIDFRVDFDGSFWQSYNVELKRLPFNEFPKGSMTLLTEEVAVFRTTEDGREVSIYFVRNDTPKPMGVCD